MRNFILENYIQEDSWESIFKILAEKNKTRFLYPVKVSFKNSGKI